MRVARRAVRHRPKKFAENYDIHIHLPEGAIPKDGPSAGVTMAHRAGLARSRRIPVRRDVAMTGEITLRGRVLPIGGLKEKTLAAHRAGIKTVLIPKENKKDLQRHPEADPRRSCASSRWSSWTTCCARRWCWRSRRSSAASPPPSRSRCQSRRRRRPEDDLRARRSHAEADTLDLGFFSLRPTPRPSGTLAAEAGSSPTGSSPLVRCHLRTRGVCCWSAGPVERSRATVSVPGACTFPRSLAKEALPGLCPGQAGVPTFASP